MLAHFPFPSIFYRALTRTRTGSSAVGVIWALGRLLAADTKSGLEGGGDGGGGGAALFGHAVRALRQIAYATTTASASRTLFLIAVCQSCEADIVGGPALQNVHNKKPPRDPHAHTPGTSTLSADTRLLAGFFCCRHDE